MTQIVIRPAAAADIDQAFLWYERQRYGVFYQIDGELIIVVACMHGRRNPRRWKSRT
ncbi:MAG: hypothetical protein ACREVS_23165 [Burkholderiales bacterium]